MSGFASDHVSIPQRYGGGYMASLEFAHQVHCVVRIENSRRSFANVERGLIVRLGHASHDNLVQFRALLHPHDLHVR